MTVYVAEFIGTAVLMLLGNGVVANVVLRGTKGHAGGWIVITAGWGFAVFIAVAMVGPISGAHINPAVTAGVFAFENLTNAADPMGLSKALGYMGAQMLGAFFGTSLVVLTYWKHYQATEDQGAKLATFSTGPEIRTIPWNFVTEVVGTFMLVFAVFYIGENAPSLNIIGAGETRAAAELGLGSIGAVPVGLLVFAIGLSLGGPTGYAINPARDLGPRIAHAVLPIPNKGPSDWGYSLVPVIGPLVGGLLAALVAFGVGTSIAPADDGASAANADDTTAIVTSADVPTRDG
jgi:glycerol uptake facilitator protein